MTVQQLIDFLQTLPEEDKKLETFYNIREVFLVRCKYSGSIKGIYSTREKAEEAQLNTSNSYIDTWTLDVPIID